MSIPDNALLAGALHLARLGYKVFPAQITPDGDKPPCRGVLWTRAATSEEREVRALWAKYPDGIPAIATGASRIVVIDLDVKAGQGGPANWLAAGGSDDAPGYATPSGGMHRFYGVGEYGWAVGNSAGAVAPGVDVRGVGGYVLCYVPDAITVGPDALPPMPRFVKDRSRPDQSAPAAVLAVRDEFGPPQRPREFTEAEAWRYVEAEALAPLRAARPGWRNTQLNASAAVVGHFVPAFWPVERVTEVLTEIALSLGLGVTETRATVRSGLEFGMTEPYARVAGLPPDPAVPDPQAPDAVELLLAKMLDRDALDSIPEPEPLIGRLLHKDTESWVIGAPGGFKSFVALDWAAHVGQGLPWRGLDTRQGPVVYIAAEGQKGIPQRVRAWEATYGRRLSGVTFLPEPVQVKGPDTDRTGQPAPGWLVLVEACRRLEPALIVLDTQARMTVGLEENSNTAMGVLIEAVRLLKRATGACVLVVHHTGRNGKDARGASALDGAQDTEIRVDRPTEAEERAKLGAVISVDKNKDSTEDLRFEIEMEVVDLGESKYGGRITSLALKPFDLFGDPPTKREMDYVVHASSLQMEVLEALREFSNETGATAPMVMRWVYEQRKRKWDDKARPLADSSARRALDALVEREICTLAGSARWVLRAKNPDGLS